MLRSQVFVSPLNGVFIVTKWCQLFVQNFYCCSSKSTFQVWRSFKIFHYRKIFLCQITVAGGRVRGKKRASLNWLEYMALNFRLHFIRTLILTSPGKLKSGLILFFLVRLQLQLDAKTSWFASMIWSCYLTGPICIPVLEVVQSLPKLYAVIWW